MSASGVSTVEGRANVADKPGAQQMSPGTGATRAPAFWRSFFRGRVSANAPVEPLAEREQPIREAIERRDWEQALTALMDVYGQRVYRYCLHMVRDPHLAEDV